MPKITVIPPTINPLTKLPTNALVKRKVAAYARVSTDQEEQLTSYEAQVDYYTKYIKSKPEWEFVKVYTDEGISATNTKRRDGFKQMIEDAIQGKIDLIVTKSVSRFARNTVDSLTYIRKLKEAGVECYFEKENIYTFDGKGELLITIMSSLAQEESRSISENVTWGQRKSFSDGKVHLAYARFLGYEKGENGKPKVIPDEAKIVKLIYRLFLDGMSACSIAQELQDAGIPTASKKGKWSVSTVLSILKNEKYKGDALLQKSFTVDFLEHKKKKNEGEVQQYYIENSHEAIVEPEEWEQVQIELARRIKLKGAYSSSSVFSSKLICEDCGGLYGQKVWHSTSEYKRYIWQCNNKFKKGKAKCLTPTLNEDTIKQMFYMAYNQLMMSRERIIQDCKEMTEGLVDFEKLELNIQKKSAEVNIIAEKVKAFVADYASATLPKDEFNEKYVALENKYNETYEKYQKLLKLKEHRISQAKAIKVFIKALEEKPLVLDEWDSSCWALFVDKAIVHKDKSITFQFNSGTSIKIEALK